MTISQHKTRRIFAVAALTLAALSLDGASVAHAALDPKSDTKINTLVTDH